MSITKPVIVLGMHRSGTSMLAHCLIKLGVNMGDDLLQPDEGNPLGYFEDKDFLKLNKEIIQAAGGEWTMPTSRKSLHQVFKKFQNPMSELLQDRINNNIKKHWGWKDPRNSLTAWMWHEHIVTHEPKYLIIYRNRTAIMASLKRRNADMVNWARLAKAYSEHISVFIRRDSPKVHIVHYEDFIKNKEKAYQELDKIVKFLELRGVNIWKAVEEVIKFEGV